MRAHVNILLLIIFALLLSGCKGDIPDDKEYEPLKPENVVAKNDRLFGINLSEGKNGFMDAYTKGASAGIQVVELNIPWNAIEVGPRNYVDPYGGVFAATGFYGDNNIRLVLSIAVINTVDWETPSYLRTLSPDAPEFRAAFDSMITWVIDNIPSNVKIEAISIGNEVNLVLETDRDWVAYTKFFQSSEAYLNRFYPDLKVGVKTTVKGGLFGEDRERIKEINSFADVIMLNYYPQNSQFQVDEPAAVYDHFLNFTAEFPEKDIYLTEVGYQSGSALCGSSETKQAEFYHHFFRAWDLHEDKVKLVVINWLNDQSAAQIEEWKDYYGSDEALLEYLSSLGLCKYNGDEKYAWLQLMEEVKARGWAR